MLARRRHRSATLWAVLGAISGPISAILLLAAPLGQCPMCWAPVKGWGPTCMWCGTDVRDLGTAAPGRRGVPPVRQEAATLAAALAEERQAAALPGTTARPDTLESAAAAPAVASVPHVTEQTAAERLGAQRAEHLTPVAEPTSVAVDRGQVVNLPVAGPQVLGSAIFVTGSVGLRAGSWYTLELDGRDLVVRGPLEVDPRASVLVRQVGEIDSYAFNGQLIVHGERGLVLVFMRVSGDTADHLAEVIADAARGAGQAAS